MIVFQNNPSLRKSILEEDQFPSTISWIQNLRATTFLPHYLIESFQTQRLKVRLLLPAQHLRKSHKPINKHQTWNLSSNILFPPVWQILWHFHKCTEKKVFPAQKLKWTNMQIIPKQSSSRQEKIRKKHNKVREKIANASSNSFLLFLASIIFDEPCGNKCFFFLVEVSATIVRRFAAAYMRLSFVCGIGFLFFHFFNGF